MAQQVVKTENTDIIAPSGQAEAFVQMLERAVTNPLVDVGKMQAIMDMKIQAMRYQAEVVFKAEMAKVLAEMPVVVRNRDNGQTNSKYADLEAVMKAAKPVLHKYGFYDSYDFDYPAEKMIGTTCILTHKDGHESRTRVQFPYDDVGIKGSVNKTQIHGAASAMTYGERISLCTALGIQIARDDDGNAAGSQAVTEEQLATLQSWVDGTKTDTRSFCEIFEINDLSLMAARDFPKAMNMLKAKDKVLKAKAEKVEA